MAIAVRVDPFPSNEQMNNLWSAAWGIGTVRDFSLVLCRSLGHVGAYDDGLLVGFVNVAWDGGIHAFILDTCVHPAVRRQGIATRLVKAAQSLAAERGVQWLHVDFEEHLTKFYCGCGFSPTAAGLIKIA